MKLRSLICSNDRVVCEADDPIDLPDSIAEVWIKNNWAARIVAPLEPFEQPAQPVIETAAYVGAPERALSGRGKKKLGTVPRSEPDSE